MPKKNSGQSSLTLRKPMIKPTNKRTREHGNTGMNNGIHSRTD